MKEGENGLGRWSKATQIRIHTRRRQHQNLAEGDNGLSRRA